jgi:hypothetical protein
MLMHRQIDEECGKREKAWIKTLRRRTVNTIRDTPDENYSASKELSFNRHMKQRALKKILPSLFSIAEAHEDYVVQYGLFEGSSNDDPGRARTMCWQKTPRPDRTQGKKRSRTTRYSTPARREEPQAEDSGDETEVDEYMDVIGASFSSNQSGGSEKDAPISRTPVLPPGPSLPSQPPAFNQTLGCPHLSNNLELDVKIPVSFAAMQNIAYPQPTFESPSFADISIPDASMFSHPYNIPTSMPPPQSAYGYVEMQGFTSFPYGLEQSSFGSVASGATLPPDDTINGLPMTSMHFHG